MWPQCWCDRCDRDIWQKGKIWKWCPGGRCGQRGGVKAKNRKMQIRGLGGTRETDVHGGTRQQPCIYFSLFPRVREDPTRIPYKNDNGLIDKGDDTYCGTRQQSFLDFPFFFPECVKIQQGSHIKTAMVLLTREMIRAAPPFCWSRFTRTAS